MDIFLYIETPELQKQRQALVTQSVENQKQLKSLEDKILHILVSTKGNILEDDGAVEVLATAKDLSDAIQRKQVRKHFIELHLLGCSTLHNPLGIIAHTLYYINSFQHCFQKGKILLVKSVSSIHD